MPFTDAPTHADGCPLNHLFVSVGFQFQVFQLSSWASYTRELTFFCVRLAVIICQKNTERCQSYDALVDAE